MLIKDIYSPFEKKRIITYGCNKNKVVYHYVTVQRVTNFLYKSKTEISSRGNDECELYICFDGYPGLDIGSYSHINEKTADELWQSCIDSGFDTPESYIRMLDNRAQQRRHIGNCQIELARYIEPQKAEQYIAIKKSIQEEWECRQAEKQAQYFAEQTEKERLAKQKKEKDRALLLGWGDGMSDLRLGQVLSVLSAKFRYDGEVKTRLRHVIDCISDGWIPKRRENVVSCYGSRWDVKESQPKTEYRLSCKDGNFSYIVTKTEFDFAEYLYKRKDKKYNENQQSCTPKTNAS